MKGFYREVIYKYTLKNVNLRAEPSKTAEVLNVIPQGSKVKVIDMEDEWTEISFDSQTGWVDNDYISASMHPWNNVKLRDSKSLTSRAILVIPKGARVEVLSVEGPWSKVIYDDKEGYVYNYYLSQDGTNTNIIDYKYFYSDINKFVTFNDIKSTTEYLLVTDLNNKYTYVFIEEQENWKMLYKWECTIGKPSTPTIKGIFFINGRKPYFGTDKYRVKYATRIKDGYYYHSILYNSTGTYIIDGRLGLALSHGCIRLETDNAKWIYENVPDDTTVIIH